MIIGETEIIALFKDNLHKALDSKIITTPYSYALYQTFQAVEKIEPYRLPKDYKISAEELLQIDFENDLMHEQFRRRYEI